MEQSSRVMSEFCEEKGIKKEFSIARTPQQNGAAERRNKTLIEAARTMYRRKYWCSDTGKKDDEGVNKESGFDDQERPENSTQDVNTASTNVNTGSLNINTVSPTFTTASLEATNADFFGDETEVDMSNITTTYPVPSTPNTRIHKDHSLNHVIGDVQCGIQTRRMTKTINEQGFISVVYEGKTQEDLHTCLNKKDERVARIEAIRLFLAYASFKDFVVYQMDVKSAFLYGKIEEEVYVCQPPGFEDPEFPDRVYKVEKALYGLHQAPRAWYETFSTYLLDNGFQRGQIDKTLFIKRVKCDILLVQVYVDDIIFGSTKKELCTEFEKLMHKKFQMSSMGELTFFLGLQVTPKDDGIFISQDKYVDENLKKFGFSIVKTTSTPMETSKPMRNENDEDVDVHLYRSMIGSLMYLISSRLDIMFVVCACARFQVTPKDSPFDLEAYTDSDYAGASLDRKSTTGGCQFLGSRLISWQCKKQTIVANSTTKAEYVATATVANDEIQVSDVGLTYYYVLTKNPTIYTSCIKQFWDTAKAKTVNGEVQIQALVDGKKVIVTNTSVRRALQLKDAEEPMADETENVESVPTHSNDPLLSGEDRLKLNELMERCTNLSQRVPDLENIKTYQVVVITKLKERVKKLERRNKSRTPGLKRLRKVGRSAQVFSSEDEDEQEVEVEKIIAAKPKAVTTAATTTTTTVTRPKARGVIVQEPSEFRTTTSTSQTSQLPQAKDKGKAKMIELEKPLKKKDQILIDEEIAQKLQAHINAELEEEEKLAKQEEEDANIAEWDNVQAMIDVDYELAARLQAQEQEELTVEEKSKLLVELMDKRKKHFARLRAKELRRKPPTKA
ncbi:putative ribonuclease H-like domain-containing protein [Tanacetum coccineum]|uniref:Ribonuclease H-like domain-containing protein n=1 Tax=Tanacetum coccineum TaxID=301880 RepID=A0ABQ5J2B4_9ASTR